MDKNSKIYIAGNNGMVGSAIQRNLESKGYNNFVFTPWPEYDLMNQEQTADFFKQEKPEYVVLAAAKVGGIIANNTYRGQFIYENLQIQNNVIHQSYLNGVKKLLFLGSSCIYPKACPQPMQEQHLLTSTLEYTNEPYAIAKIAGLKMCESYNLQYSTNFIAVMPTNLYGINDNYDLEKSHVLPALIRKMHLGRCLHNNELDCIKEDLNKRPVEGVNGTATDKEIIAILEKYGITKEDNTKVELWGSGLPRREFLHADDMADASVYIMENVDFNDLVKINKVESEIKNTHINIGTGVDLSIKELALLVKEIVGFEGEILWDKTKPDGTIRKQLDVGKLHKLGWKHKINLEDGISSIYQSYVSEN
jgi:GDP-L-fucose synthase